MNKIEKFIKSLNKTQKLGLFVGVFACFLMLFLHNPTQGYMANCAPAYVGDLEFAPAIIGPFVDHWYECVSYGAITPLFQVVSVWLFGEAVAVIMTVFWVWIFGVNKNQNNE